MASEQADEKDPEFQRLVGLERAVEEAHAAATGAPYTPEGWKPWREAAASFQAAVTAYAAADEKRSRYEVEMRVKKTVLHPEDVAV